MFLDTETFDAVEDTVLGLNRPKEPSFLTSINDDDFVYTTSEAINGFICDVLVS